MNQKTLSPALACLLGGTIYDLSMDLATMEEPLNEWQTERYLEHHSLEFLRDEIARNSVVQSEILFSALEEDFHTPSVYETRMDSIPNLMTLKRGDLHIEGMMWNRLIGHFFERFLIRVKQGVLSQ
jgi:hypothetical protein